MEPVLTRCGYRCDLCLAYAPNIQAHPENAQALSDGWYFYFGFHIEPEDIYCDGCLAENGHLLDAACPVRPCVLEKGLENCAYCEDYSCLKLEERLVIYEDIRAKLGKEVSCQDYQLFIQPYENKLRLEALRKPGEPERERD